MKNILFVCTGNSCRSVMAERLFKKMTEDRAHEFSIASAGISAFDGYPPTQDTVQTMKAEGIDVSDHRSRRLTLPMIEAADKIYVMERMHRDWVLHLSPDVKEKVILLGECAPHATAHGEIDIPDPIRMSPQFYKNTLSVIQNCLKKILEDKIL